jgi:hypothetical protein
MLSPPLLETPQLSRRDLILPAKVLGGGAIMTAPIVESAEVIVNPASRLG